MPSFKLDRSTQRQLNSFRKELIKVPNDIWWIAGAGIIGIVIYLVLSGKNLTEPPFPIIDPTADFIGSTTGLEGAGEEWLPDLPIGSSMNKSAGYMNGQEAEALAATVGSRLSIA